MFFERGETDKDNTKEVWIYDLRTNMPSFGKRNQLSRTHLEDFIEKYKADERKEDFNTEDNPNARWRKYTIDQIKSRENTSLDISWMTKDSDEEDLTLEEMLQLMAEKSKSIEESVAKLHELLKDVKE